MNSQSDTWHLFFVWSAPCNNRGAVFPVRGPCREDMSEYGNWNWLVAVWRRGRIPPPWPCESYETTKREDSNLRQ
jgi:hypothetical protein